MLLWKFKFNEKKGEFLEKKSGVGGKYKGEIKNKKADGLGIQVYRDGSRY